MHVISDYYTRSIAYKNAHRHGSLNHPQDISFLDEWYVDSNAVPKRKVGRPREQARKAFGSARMETISEVEAEPQLFYLNNAEKYLIVALDVCLLIHFLQRYPFVFAFLIAMPVIAQTMGSRYPSTVFATLLPNAHIALERSTSQLLKSSQSPNVVQTTLNHSRPAERDVLQLLNCRSHFPAAVDIDVDPIYLNRRTFQEAFADTLPRLFRSLKTAALVICNVFIFQINWGLVVTAFSLMQWILLQCPLSLASIKELWVVDWKHTANQTFLEACRNLWGWIHGLSLVIFWRLPKAIVKAFWNAAIMGVMIPGEYVRGSVADGSVSDAWGYGLHPSAQI